MGENNKGNKLIADIFRQGFPQGILKGSCNKWSNFLQFVDDRNNTYFIIRELMNKMNVTLQDMMLVMKLKVYQLDENQGLFWIKEWESIVNKIQKNPRYLESMVCLYNEQLEIVSSFASMYLSTLLVLILRLYRYSLGIERVGICF